MLERVSFPDQEVLPGVEWPEPYQPELPLSDEVMAYISKLDETLNRMESTGSVDPDVLMQFTDLWDFAIDQGWTQNNDPEAIAS